MTSGMFPMTLEEKDRIRVLMRESAERRRCPTCGKGNALVSPTRRTSRRKPLEVARMVCRYCGAGGA